MVLKQVHDTNMRAKGHPERVFSVSLTQPPAPPILLGPSHSAPIFLTPNLIIVFFPPDNLIILTPYPQSPFPSTIP